MISRFGIYVFVTTLCFAQPAVSQENASNPLAVVNNTDIKLQYFSADTGDTYDWSIDGAYMVTPKIKFRYELHYLSTDVTGRTENDLERLVLKPIWLPTKGQLNSRWQYKTAFGLEAVFDLGDQRKGIGTGSDQIAPFFGLALNSAETGWTLIPLVQHFASVGGDTNIAQTAARLIALRPFGEANWVKLDLKLPYGWENDAIPATAEIQLGRNINPGKAVFVDVLGGLGNDRPYDIGLGVGIRFNY